MPSILLRDWRVLAGAMLCICATTAWASDHLRAYSKTGLVASEFKGTRPDGAQSTAFVRTEVLTEPFGIGTLTDSKSATVTPGPISVKSWMDRSKSWIGDTKDRTPEEIAKLLEHEQGHIDEAEQAARNAQAEINTALENKTLQGKGKTLEEAKTDLTKKIKEIIDRAKEAVEDKNKDRKNDYDVTTDHGRKGTEQDAARKRQKNALLDPSTDPAKKTGAEADSHTKRSIHFDATAGVLLIDQDFIIATRGGNGMYTPDPLDRVLGAELIAPAFNLAGSTTDGLFFFGAVDPDARLRIADAQGDLFSADVAYLMYDPELNLFFAITGGREAEAGNSAFIDELLAGPPAGLLALFGVEWLPDVDFFTASAGFTADADSAATNGAGLRIVGTALPVAGTLWLVLPLLLPVLASALRKPRPADRLAQPQRIISAA